jgi:hypothetical protein
MGCPGLPASSTTKYRWLAVDNVVLLARTHDRPTAADSSFLDRLTIGALEAFDASPGGVGRSVASARPPDPPSVPAARRLSGVSLRFERWETDRAVGLRANRDSEPAAAPARFRGRLGGPSRRPGRQPTAARVAAQVGIAIGGDGIRQLVRSHEQPWPDVAHAGSQSFRSAAARRVGVAADGRRPGRRARQAAPNLDLVQAPLRGDRAEVAAGGVEHVAVVPWRPAEPAQVQVKDVTPVSEGHDGTARIEQELDGPFHGHTCAFGPRGDPVRQLAGSRERKVIVPLCSCSGSCGQRTAPPTRRMAAVPAPSRRWRVLAHLADVGPIRPRTGVCVRVVNDVGARPSLGQFRRRSSWSC